MGEITTIQLDKALVDSLKKEKDYPRQTYAELIKKMLKIYASFKNNTNHYDRFLHEIQKAKMKELWDNPYDDRWDNV